LNSGYLSAGHYICVRIRDYYSKPRGVREKNVWVTVVHTVLTINNRTNIWYRDSLCYARSRPTYLR